MFKIICTTAALEENEDNLDDDILEHDRRQSTTDINLNQPPPNHSNFIVFALYVFLKKMCPFSILIFCFIGEEDDQGYLTKNIFHEEIVELGQRKSAIIDLNQSPSSNGSSIFKYLPRMCC